jgi:hypothetical protein
MITWLAKSIFNLKAKALGKKMFKDPRMIKIFDNYIEDQKKFKAELKRLGLTSRQDLIEATKNDPNLDTYKDLM